MPTRVPSAESIAAEHAVVRRLHPLGHRVHLALGMAYLLLLALSTAPKDAAFALLVLCTCLRLPQTWRTYRWLARDPLGWACLAWAGWQAISILWSDDPAQGWDELQAFRGLVTVLLLWPVVDQVVWLIGAFLAGVLLQNLVQLMQQQQWLGLHPAVNQRLRGLLHPIHTATICLVGMCWFLSAILHGSWRWRWPAAAGMILAGAGLVFTGSRGPWIAAAVTLPAALLIIAWRRPETRRAATAVAVACGIGGAVLWPVAGDLVARRVDQTRADLTAAGAGDFDSHVGVRLASGQAAWSMFRGSTVAGVGAGGFEPGLAGTRHATLLDGADHAHSLYLHVLACTGLIGGTIVAAVAVAALRQAARDRPDHPFADGALFGLLGWLVAATFDAYHLAGQMVGVFAMLTALTVTHRPPPAPLPSWRRHEDTARSGDGT